MPEVFKVIIFIIVILGFAVFYGLKKGFEKLAENLIAELPQRIHEVKLENMRIESAEYLQVDNFYREISGKKLLEIFSNWLEIIADIDSFEKKTIGKKGEKYILDLLKEVALYGSSESLRRVAVLQQFNFQNEERGDDEKESPYVLMYLAAYLIAQLKKDFTGHEIDVDDLIKLRMKDYKQYEHTMKESKIRAKEVLNIE